MTTPSPNLEDARRFLTALDPTAVQFSFLTRDDKEDRQELVRPFHAPFEDVSSALVDLNMSGAAVCIVINRTDFQGLASKNILAARAVFVDIDDDHPRPGAGALPLSMIVRTGNGFHGYWLLREEADLSRWRLVQRAIVKKLRADEAAVLATQSLRLPGYLHQKGEPLLVALEQCHPDRRYALDEIIKAYSLEQLIKPPTPKPPRKPPDADSPFDDFNDRGSWGFLERHGWEVVRRDGDTCHWKRPGKRRRGTSATTGADGKKDLFFVFSSEAPPFEADQGYSRTQAFALLEHAGDYKAVAKDLVAQGYGKSSDDRKRAFIQEREEAQWSTTLADEPSPQTKAPDWKSRDDDEWGATLDTGPPPEEPKSDEPDFDTTAANSAPRTSGDSSGKRGKKTGKKRGKKSGKKRAKAGTRKPRGKPKPESSKSVHGLPPKGNDAQDGLCNFRVSRVTKWATDPPTYHFQIEEQDQELILTLNDLDSPAFFRRRYLATFDRRPSLPTGEDYSILVNYWLQDLHYVDQPEESSEFGSLCSELRDLLRSLRLGEIPIDLEHGKVLPHPTKTDWYIVKRTKVRKLISDELGGRPVAPDMLSKAMTSLHCEAERPRLTEMMHDGTEERSRPEVWAFHRALDQGDEPPSDGADSPPDGSHSPQELPNEGPTIH